MGSRPAPIGIPPQMKFAANYQGIEADRGGVPSMLVHNQHRLD